MDVDWTKNSPRAVEMLQALLRIDTRNPPGNERPAAEYIAGQLRAYGLEPRFIEGRADRTNVICRIEGTGERAPLLLTGHTDVVPVEEQHWDQPPFAGNIVNGYLFGRGAIDMKNHVTACLTMVQLLAEQGVRPRRDVIFAAVADEEEGCTWGSRYLVENHPDEVRAEYMIGEIGGFTQYINGLRYYPIQIAEKGAARIKMIARGKPGHGSMPHPEMAITRLAQALSVLGTTRLPQHSSKAMERFIGVLASTQRPPARWVLPRLLNPRLSGVLLDRALPPDLSRVIGALLHNTVSPTMLEGGVKFNVIPSEVSCLLDGRLIPGQSAEDLLRELRALVGELVEFELLDAYPGVEQRDPASPLYTAMVDSLAKFDPAGIPLPNMVPGFTDAQFFSRLGIRCYGFSPLQFPEADNVRFSELFHGHNERIHVDGFRWGLKVLWEVVRRMVL